MNAIPSTRTLFARIEPDERRLDDVDEPSPQREDRDEELGQIAEGGLDDARTPGPEPGTELLCRSADKAGKSGERERGDNERDDVAGSPIAARRRDEDDGEGDPDFDRLAPVHREQTVTDPRTRDEPWRSRADN